MDDAASRAFIQEQVDRLRALAPLLSITSIEVDGYDVFVTFKTVTRGQELAVRLRCDNGYPIVPPSVSFVNPVDKRDGQVSFWPSDGEQAIKRGNNPPFICLPGIREYHERHQGAPPTPADVSLARLVSELVSRLNR
jgi:hypothetical protein